MRNLKKILALVLALVMSMSLVTVASAAYTDQDTIDARYNEAVQVLSGMGIFKGYEDGSFNPKGLITREEVATMMYRVISEDVTDAMDGLYVEACNFGDVANTKWSAGFIGYCYNGNYIKGYEDGTFGPAKNVTGYEVLAMILRAVGFDKNGEFSGSNWKKNIGTVAQQLGILNNVAPTVVLSAPATRELVAELIFRTLVEAEMVEYTPAFGYQPVLTSNLTETYTTTLGEKNFGLYPNAVEEMDDWGRPAKAWHYDCGAKVTYLPYAKVFETNVETTECDIAKAVGFGNTKAIESAWIDGNQVDAAIVTSNGVASIAALATTSEIGAQGCITEVYAIGNTLRVVEINTYLGQITNVVPATTDRNGHTKPAESYVSVYTGNGDNAFDVTLKSPNNDFAYGEYVLVQIPFIGTANKQYVADIKVANRAAAGSLLGWTNEVFTTAGTHTLTVGKYNDADKFELNYRADGNWDVLTDSFGNIIGLVESATNYAVVEKLQWMHNASSFGGYALADIVLANGERVSGVTIASVDGIPTNNVGDFSGIVAQARVSDNLANNTAYYNHIFVYSVNANGTYNLATIAAHDGTQANHFVLDVTGASYDNRNATINSQNNVLVATDNTVFLMKNSDGYTYTTYVGRTVPSFNSAVLCIMTDSLGFAKTVVIEECTLVDSAYLVAYVVDTVADTYVNMAGTWVNGYHVYEIGKTEPTMIYDIGGNFANDCATTGIYNFRTNSANFYLGVAASLADTTVDAKDTFGNGNTYYCETVRAGVSGNSFQVTGYDFLVSGETVVINVDYDVNGVATLTAGTFADIAADKVVMIEAYYAAADCIYVVDRDVAPAAPAVGTVSNATAPATFTELKTFFAGTGVSDAAAQFTAYEMAELNVTSANGLISIASKAGTELNENPGVKAAWAPSSATLKYFITLQFTAPANFAATSATWVGGGTDSVGPDGIFDFILCLEGDETVLNRQIAWTDGITTKTVDVVIDLSNVKFG